MAAVGEHRGKQLISTPEPRIEFQEKTFAAGVVTINYAEGPANGPPLIFLHGIGKTWRDFLTMMPAFPEWQVFALDLRGHGKSGHVAKGYRAREYSSDVIALIRDSLRQPVVIYGHSLGGIIAMCAAAEHPERVRAIIVGDTAISSDTLTHSTHQELFKNLYKLVLRGGSTEEMAARLAAIEIRVPGLAGTVPIGDLLVNDEAGLLKWAEGLQQVDPGTFESTIDGSTLADFDAATLLPMIRCPMLVLQANPELDGLMPDSAIDTIRQHVPQVRVQKMRLLGHALHLQRTEPVIDAVLPFLKSI